MINKYNLLIIILIIIIVQNIKYSYKILNKSIH